MGYTQEGESGACRLVKAERTPYFYEKICAHRKDAEKGPERTRPEMSRVLAWDKSDDADCPVEEKRENDTGGRTGRPIGKRINGCLTFRVVDALINPKNG